MQKMGLHKQNIIQSEIEVVKIFLSISMFRLRAITTTVVVAAPRVLLHPMLSYWWILG